MSQCAHGQEIRHKCFARESDKRTMSTTSPSAKAFNLRPELVHDRLREGIHGGLCQWVRGCFMGLLSIVTSVSGDGC
jgi:hypothetical protein